MLKVLDQKSLLKKYLKESPKVTYEMVSLSDLLGEKKMTKELSSYLSHYFGLPNFIVDSESIYSMSDLLSAESSSLYDTSDASIKMDSDGNVLEIKPDKRLPVYYLSQVETVVDLMSDNSRISLVESIVEDGTVNLLYTKTGYENLGGVVFSFYDSSSSVSVRRYSVIRDNLIAYVPSKRYNRSSGRYDRYTDSYKLSVSILVQRVLEDLDNNTYLDSIYKESEDIDLESLLSLEEVTNIVLSTGESSPDNVMMSYREDPNFEDMYYDYLWRCSNIKTKISDILDFLLTSSKESVSSEKFRNTLGSVLFGLRIGDRLYKETT